ncbi:MAG: flavin reductase [Chloroflexota bacterium]|nr:MAG: flavin reductase [Chloroflexota bacterium]
MPSEQDQFRKVMRQWASGVCVVTTNYFDVYHGMTVSSFSSVSIEPQLVTISLMKNSRTHDFVLDAKIFGITVLSETQKEISKIFAGLTPETENRFDGLETWTLVTGSPFLKEGLAFLDCRLIDVDDFGTNSLFIGEVVAAKVGNGGKPLLYFDQQYHLLQE